MLVLLELYEWNFFYKSKIKISLDQENEKCHMTAFMGPWEITSCEMATF